MENTAPVPSLQAVHWIWLKTPIPRVRIRFKLKHRVEQKKPQSLTKVQKEISFW